MEGNSFGGTKFWGTIFKLIDVNTIIWPKFCTKKYLIIITPESSKELCGFVVASKLLGSTLGDTNVKNPYIMVNKFHFMLMLHWERFALYEVVLIIIIYVLLITIIIRFTTEAVVVKVELVFWKIKMYNIFQIWPNLWVL